MPVFRVDKTRDYTVMSNHHLRNTELTLKAKGLLSLMLSLPETWDYTLFGLTKINDDGIDGIRAAVNELERHGYLTRRRIRNGKGQLTETEYTILEHPASEKPMLENPTQINTNPIIPKEKNTHVANIHQSIYPATPDDSGQLPEKEMDRIDRINSYRDLVMDNIEYDFMAERYSRERMDEIVDVIMDAMQQN